MQATLLETGSPGSKCGVRPALGVRRGLRIAWLVGALMLFSAFPGCDAPAGDARTVEHPKPDATAPPDRVASDASYADTADVVEERSGLDATMSADTIGEGSADIVSEAEATADAQDGAEEGAALADASVDVEPRSEGSANVGADAEVDADDGFVDAMPTGDGGGRIDTDAELDTGMDAVASQSSATAALILSARNQACVDCAVQNHCLDTGSSCDDLKGKLAAGGPDAGESREQLCLDTLGCIFSSRCYLIGSVACLCGPETQLSCASTGPLLDGGAQCVRQEQAGLETTNIGTELQVQSDNTLGAGMANALVTCITNAFCGDCL